MQSGLHELVRKRSRLHFSALGSSAEMNPAGTICSLLAVKPLDFPCRAFILLIEY
jgi:hypothetical protein